MQTNVLPAILFAAMHDKQATVNATADHAELLDVGAQQGLVGESGPERVQRWRRENKLSNVEQILKEKKKKKLCVMIERTMRSQAETTGDYGSRAACCKTAAVEPLFVECAVNMFRESS